MDRELLADIFAKHIDAVMLLDRIKRMEKKTQGKEEKKKGN